MDDHARDPHDDQADQEHTTDCERADRDNQKREPQEQSLLEDEAESHHAYQEVEEKHDRHDEYADHGHEGHEEMGMHAGHEVSTR